MSRPVKRALVLNPVLRQRASRSPFATAGNLHQQWPWRSGCSIRVICGGPSPRNGSFADHLPGQLAGAAPCLATDRELEIHGANVLCEMLTRPPTRTSGAGDAKRWSCGCGQSQRLLGAHRFPKRNASDGGAYARPGTTRTFSHCTCCRLDVPKQ